MSILFFPFFKIILLLLLLLLLLYMNLNIQMNHTVSAGMTSGGFTLGGTLIMFSTGVILSLGGGGGALLRYR